jgi:hypothetical protein
MDGHRNPRRVPKLELDGYDDSLHPCGVQTQSLWRPPNPSQEIGWRDYAYFAMALSLGASIESRW